MKPGSRTGLALVLAVVATALAVIALTGCGGDDEAGGDEMTVELAAVGDSGQSGTATLTANGEMTDVVVEVDDPVSASQPAHIHEGSCADLNPAPALGLPNVVDGASQTTVDASLDDLTTGGYAINLHMSDDDLTTYTSCGDIKP
jgi:hypothetical protein